MKKIFIFITRLLIGMEIFATPLIDAAKNQDYKAFEMLVNNGANLDETNNSGMNVQIALAYFSNSDFKKACTLLSTKNFDFDVPVENNISLLYVLAYSCSFEKISVLLKYNVDVNRKNSITNLKPIDVTQFSTFNFYSEQKINPSAYKRAEKTRELLLQNGSEAFTNCELNMATVGNAFFCLFNIIKAFFPFITPEIINTPDLFDFPENNGQISVTMRQDKMKELFDTIELDVEISNYYDSKKILDKLVDSEVSEYAYMLFAITGNSPIAPYQWVNINNGEYSTNPSLSKDLVVGNPDALFQFVDFQVKDISQLVAIKIKNLD